MIYVYCYRILLYLSRGR